MNNTSQMNTLQHNEIYTASDITVHPDFHTLYGTGMEAYKKPTCSITEC